MIVLLFRHIFPCSAAELTVIDDLGLRLAPGFHITLYADSDLANDIYAMTLDAKGRVVVTGRGYIKTLHDTDGDGKADQATTFASTPTGGMGLCFDGNNLYFSGDGGLWLYRDTNGDGQADGPPEKILSAAFSEHGAHAIRKGPDGGWYFIGGNDSGFSAKQVNLAESPVIAPEGGALLRLSPDGRKSEIIAHGLRNPYDFDFNSAGDIFTYDSDVENDYFLPWYTPTRLYHLGYGGHHGWRLGGWTRSWNRPDYYVDTVDILAPVGRGSPTGVVCYRHTQFPRSYHDGLFALDWTFGRIYFFALKADGTSYKTEPELFLEPIGTHGFAPNDAVVAPDGSLFISIGGRKTRGAVFRIQYGEAQTTPKAPARNRRAGAKAESLTETSALGSTGSTSKNKLGAGMTATPAPVRVGKSPTGAGRLPAPPTTETGSAAGPDSLESVLKSPQPLDAWSRAQWMPQAQRLGAQPFKLAVVNDRLAPAQRVRAIEVMTEMFGGLETARAMVAARSHSPQVRARVAWSVGRAPCEDLGLVLLPLAKDNHPGVRRSALESLADRVTQVDSDDLLSVLPANLGHPDKRLRQAAARLAKLLPEAAWKKLSARVENASLQTQLTAVLAGIWRALAAPVHPETLARLSLLLPKITDTELRLDAVRLVMLTLGDYHLQNPSTEVYTAYELPGSMSEISAVGGTGYQPVPSGNLPDGTGATSKNTPGADLTATPAPVPVGKLPTGAGRLPAPPITQTDSQENAALRRVRQNLRDSFPSGEAALDFETARLLGMLEDDSPELLDKLISLFTSGSSPTSDFHYLVVLSRLPGPRNDDQTKTIAQAILGLDKKLAQQGERNRQNWHPRLAEVVSNLGRRDPHLADALLRHPEFAAPGHVGLAASFSPDQRLQAARLFKSAVENRNQFPWSGALVDLLGELPAPEVFPLFRQQWANLALREKILAQLARRPDSLDRSRYLQGLESTQPELVQTSLAVLAQLPRDPRPEHLVPLLRLLHRSLSDPRRVSLRSAVSALINRQADASLEVHESATDLASLQRVYRPVFAWFEQRHPQWAKALVENDGEDPARWNNLLKSVAWEKGDAVRGETLFRERACQMCHASANGLGPDLHGVAGRYSAEDLFRAIVFPSRDVASPYRTTVFETRDGQSYAGLVAFESADGVLVQTGAASTTRLAASDITSRRASDLSVMPSGLLDGLKAEDLANLYSFLKSLNAGDRSP